MLWWCDVLLGLKGIKNSSSQVPRNLSDSRIYGASYHLSVVTYLPGWTAKPPCPDCLLQAARSETTTTLAVWTPNHCSAEGKSRTSHRAFLIGCGGSSIIIRFHCGNKDPGRGLPHPSYISILREKRKTFALGLLLPSTH